MLYSRNILWADELVYVGGKAVEDPHGLIGTELREQMSSVFRCFLHPDKYSSFKQSLSPASPAPRCLQPLVFCGCLCQTPLSSHMISAASV